MPTPEPTPPGTQAPGFFDWIGDTVNGIGSTVSGAVDFWSDPFGAMYRASREAVTSLSKDLIPSMTGATLPDLTMDAFLRTYAVSFALSLFVAVVLLVVQLGRTASGRQSGRDTLDAIGLYFPGFILGTMFGPAAGILIVSFVHALSDSIVQWAYGGSSADLAQALVGPMLADPTAFAGGVYVAAIVGWTMAIGLLFLVLLFVVQLLTLYFAGVLLPLATVWVIDPARRSSGIKAVSMWVGILLTQPLLFLLVGFALRLISSALTGWGSDGWKNLISLLIATLALWAAALAPFFLLRYLRTITAPAAPVGASTGPTIGDAMPGRRHPSSSSPATSDTASRGGQPVRNSTAPPGRSLRDAATSRGGGGGGAVQTATAAGASRAGMVATTASATARAARNTYRATEDAAGTSVSAPPAESYGKDRP